MTRVAQITKSDRAAFAHWEATCTIVSAKQGALMLGVALNTYLKLRAGQTPTRVQRLAMTAIARKLPAWGDDRPLTIKSRPATSDKHPKADEVKALHAAGTSITMIANRLKLGRTTVRRLLAT